MLKLKKFQEKKINNKNIIVSFAILIGLLSFGYLSKSYAIYKMQKEFDVIKSKVGSFSSGDVKVAVLVDGKETSEFPSYETNYRIESVECTNGVTGSFDVENWQVTIADMKATSTKCTVSFNSKETNEITPVNMSKTELIALNEEIKNTSAKQLANYLYPVGSIYMSTEDDTVEKVEDKFGGTWVKYSSGTTLVGDDGTNYITNDTSKGSGGSSTVTLKTENLPNFSLSGTTNNTGSGYKFGYTSSTRTTSTNGAHTHHIKISWPEGNYGTLSGGSIAQYSQPKYYATFYSESSGNHNHTVSDTYANSLTGVESHNHTFTANYTNNKQEVINIQNPYTVVYMYKRTA